MQVFSQINMFSPLKSVTSSNISVWIDVVGFLFDLFPSFCFVLVDFFWEPILEWKEQFSDKTNKQTHTQKKNPKFTQYPFLKL